MKVEFSRGDKIHQRILKPLKAAAHGVLHLSGHVGGGLGVVFQSPFRARGKTVCAIFGLMKCLLRLCDSAVVGVLVNGTLGE